jgi:hypothetical protein
MMPNIFGNHVDQGSSCLAGAPAVAPTSGQSKPNQTPAVESAGQLNIKCALDRVASALRQRIVQGVQPTVPTNTSKDNYALAF